jgi:hypothetical protein
VGRGKKGAGKSDTLFSATDQDREKAMVGGSNLQLHQDQVICKLETILGEQSVT